MSNLDVSKAPLLRNVALLRYRKIGERESSWIFGALFSIASYKWSSAANDPDNAVGYEGLLVGIVAALYLLFFLLGEWFVTFRRAVEYTTVTDVSKATHVFVEPYLDKSSQLEGGPTVIEAGSEIVPLQRVDLSNASKLHERDFPSESRAEYFSFAKNLTSMSTYRFVFHSANYELHEDPMDKSNWQVNQLPLPVEEPLKRYVYWKGWPTLPAVTSIVSRFGSNSITIPVPSFLELAREHSVSPFFVFQVACVALWMLDEYVWYSLFTLLMLTAMETILIMQRISTTRMLRGMRPVLRPLWVYRSNAWYVTSGENLVPMDIVSLSRDVPNTPAAQIASNTQGAAAAGAKSNAPGANTVPCPADILLLQGVVVSNEAMLTGESTPQVKEALSVTLSSEPNGSAKTPKQGHVTGSTPKASEIEALETPLNAFALQGERAHARSVVYAGTSILTTDAGSTTGSDTNAVSLLPSNIPPPPDGGCVGLVIRTGSYTAQGELLRTIQHASSGRQNMTDKDAFIFLGIMLVFALLASGYVLHHGLSDPAADKWKLALHCIMIITTVVPPELPIQISVATNASIATLAKRGIYCTEPVRIPAAGMVDTVAFDKTGTLTADEFTLSGIVLLPEPASASHTAVKAAVSSSLDTTTSTTSGSGNQVFLPGECAPFASRLVMLGCQALMAVETWHTPPVRRVPFQPPPPPPQPVKKLELAGDPIEKTAVAGLKWTVDARGIVRPNKTLLPDLHPVLADSSVTVLKKWPFCSTLRRMTCVVSVNGSLDAGKKPLPDSLHSSAQTSIADGDADGNDHGKSTSGRLQQNLDKKWKQRAQNAYLALDKPAATGSGSASKAQYVVCKGAPETIEKLLKTVPEHYVASHEQLASGGARILALAYKPLPASTSAGTLSNLTREKAESDLLFAGFMIASCPLKSDSLRTVAELTQAGVNVIMITGDAPLTALAVSKHLKIGYYGPRGSSTTQTIRAHILDVANTVLEGASSSDVSATSSAPLLQWTEMTGNDAAQVHAPTTASQALFYAPLMRPEPGTIVVATGRALETVYFEQGMDGVQTLCAGVHVYARVSAAQKEQVVVALSQRQRVVAMVGDGGNDVGALKVSTVGLAVVSNPELEKSFDASRLKRLQLSKQRQSGEIVRGPNGMPLAPASLSPEELEEEEEEIEALLQSERERANVGLENSETADTAGGLFGNMTRILEEQAKASSASGGVSSATSERIEALNKLQARLKELESEAGGEGGLGVGPQIATLGDASMAAPLTSKLPTPHAIVQVLRQGRCTLATTHMMFKILAVNALCASYSLSVQYLGGVKSGDSQATFAGIVASAFFFAISWAKPLRRLAPERPEKRIFNPALIASVVTLIACHVLALVLASRLCAPYTTTTTGLPEDLLRSTETGTQTATATANASLDFDPNANLDLDLDLDAVAKPTPTMAAALGSILGVQEDIKYQPQGFFEQLLGLDPVPETPNSFKPSILNSVVFLVQTASQVTTFLASYYGPPFMEPLTFKSFIAKAAIATYIFCIACALDLSNGLTEYFQLIPLPEPHERIALVAIIVFDTVVSLALDKVYRR